MLSNAANEASDVLLDLVVREGRVVRGSLSRRRSDGAAPSTFELKDDSSLPKLHHLDCSTVITWNDKWENQLDELMVDVNPKDRQDTIVWLKSLPPLFQEK